MTWCLELHGSRPWTTNAERKLHHMERAAKVKDTRQAFGWMAKAQQVPKCSAIRVFATPLAKDRRWQQDVGACFPAVKAAIDGLVDAGILPDDEQKRIALKLILEAWDEAVDSGCAPEMVASSAIFAALTDMIENYGEQAVADMVAEWPDRIREGEFTLSAK